MRAEGAPEKKCTFQVQKQEIYEENCAPKARPKKIGSGEEKEENSKFLYFFGQTVFSPSFFSEVAIFLLKGGVINYNPPVTRNSTRLTTTRRC